MVRENVNNMVNCKYKNKLGPGLADKLKSKGQGKRRSIMKSV